MESDMTEAFGWRPTVKTT